MPDKPGPKTYLLLHAGFLLFSLTGIFSKLAAGSVFLSLDFFLYYGGALLILVLYSLLWQQILKRLPLTTAYYNKAITIVWGIFWGRLIFEEAITWNMVLGGVIVFAGILIVVTDGEKGEKGEMA